MTHEGRYSEVNGLLMYYEIHGNGKPLVMIHGGGSTIHSAFGNIIPALSVKRQVIAVEMQAHGRTGDRNSELTFEQDADDVAALLSNLGISKADILGFSNGGTSALQIAIRHPEKVHKIIAASALTKRNGIPSQLWEFLNNASVDNMPEQLKEAHLRVSPDPETLKNMHDKDAGRMKAFKDIPDELLSSIQVPVLIMIGDKDIITHEHAVEMAKIIPNSRLAIIPGGHGDYLGQITDMKSGFEGIDLAVPVIEKFLDY